MFDTDTVYLNYIVVYRVNSPIRLYQTFADAQNGTEAIIRGNNIDYSACPNDNREQMLEVADKSNTYRYEMLEMVGLR